MMTDLYKRAIIQMINNVNDLVILKKIYSFIKAYLE